MTTYPVKITLEFTEEEINTLRPLFYIKDDIETQLTNFIWETINEKTSNAKITGSAIMGTTGKD